MSVPLRVLLVEDSENDALLVLRLLEQGGYAPDYRLVDTEKDMQEAINEGDWDIVISDYRMMGFDGLAALRIFHEAALDIPFILVSGTMGEETAVEAMRAGAHDYLMKDNLTRLVPAVRRELQEAEGRRARHKAEVALQSYTERLELLRRIDKAILEAQFSESIAQAAADYIPKLIPCTRATVVEFNYRENVVTIIASITEDQTGSDAGSRIPLNQIENLVACLQDGQPYVANGIEARSLPTGVDKLLQSADLQSYLFIPLVASDELIGSLNLGSDQIDAFTDEQIDIACDIANQLAVAVQQAQLYRRIRQYATELEERVAERTKELQFANEHLKALSQVKDEFVSNVSHELRTPITSIKLYHKLVTLKPDRWDDYLDKIERETDRLSVLIEDLLRLSRLDQGRAALNLLPVDLNTLGSQYAVDRTLLAQQHGVFLTFTAYTDAPPIVLADEGLLGQVLSILLTNAINYTPSGGAVTISTSQDGNRWGIRVSDTGPGIGPEEQKRVFERFFRGETGRESGVPGTGLGLSIAQEIINRHHGTIEVRSSGQPGEGTTFTVWLPVFPGRPYGMQGQETPSV